MKIKRFNEKNNWKPTDKILKVSVPEFEVEVSAIEGTEAFQRSLHDNIENNGMSEQNARDAAFLYGLEEYVYTSGNVSFYYKLFSGDGIPIDNEKLFDDTNKYNL